MTVDRIKEIQSKTAFPDSVSVCQALLQVWNECVQERMYSEEDMSKAFQNGLNRSFDSDFDRWFEHYKKK
jgi:hypothetical protein